LASMIVITLIWYRLAVHKTGEARMVPTLWIVLGPLGQSMTAATLLGPNAHLAVPAAEAAILKTFGAVYGTPVLGFALLWAVVAGIITVRTARHHLPFSLTWWTFTFPVGTCVTGTIGLALATGSSMLRTAAVVFFAALVVARSRVAFRTARCAAQGHLFLPAPVPTQTSPEVGDGGATASRVAIG
jgi:tellurite resistance protein TehA-like permease